MKRTFESMSFDTVGEMIMEGLWSEYKIPDRGRSKK